MKVKRTLAILGIFLSLFTLVYVSAEEIKIGSVSDSTLIKNDIVNIGLTYEDYFILENNEVNLKNYNLYYTIGIIENRIGASLTDVYIYCYNAVPQEKVSLYFEVEIQDIQFSLSYSNCDTKQEADKTLELLSVSENNIYKLKFTYENYFSERNYTLACKDVLTGNNSPVFEATLLASGDNDISVDYNYTSYIYITKDYFIALEFKDWDTNDWWKVICNEFDFFHNDETIIMFFYNFSSSKKIEEILELDLKYEAYNYTNVAYYDPATGESLRQLESSISNEMSYNLTKTPGQTLQSVYGEDCTFNAFTTPASDRLKEFGSAVVVDSSKFTDYEHSVLVDINKAEELYSQLKYVKKGEVFPLLEFTNPTEAQKSTSVLEKKITTYRIQNLQMTRIKYSTEGQTYNAYVADDPDDSVPGDVENPSPENPVQSGFQGLLIKIADFILNCLQINPNLVPTWGKYIIGGVILIAGCFLVLFLLPYAILFIPRVGEKIKEILIMLGTGIWFVLSLPVKLIKLIFRKKE